jgi:hypothetical protein
VPTYEIGKISGGIWFKRSIEYCKAWPHATFFYNKNKTFVDAQKTEREEK